MNSELNIQSDSHYLRVDNTLNYSNKCIEF